MNKKTEDAVRAVLKTDPDYNPIEVDAALQILKGKKAAALKAVEKFDEVLPREKVADILNVSVRTVDNYVRRGELRKIRGSTMSRALGISSVSLRDFLSRIHDEELRRAK
jgi:hypothetical protein